MVLNVNVKSVILEARELKISDQKTTSKYCFNMVYCIHAADTCRVQANRQMLLLLFIASFVVGAACRILFTRNLMSQICNKQSEILLQIGTCLVFNLGITFKYMGFNTRQRKGGWGGGGVCRCFKNDNHQNAMGYYNYNLIKFHFYRNKMMK